jgi:hypothetical protein
MRFVTLIAALMLALAACGGPSRTTYARYPGSALTFDRTTADPKALEIADKVIAAVGGTAKWSTAKQYRWSQSITHDGKEVVGGEQAWDRWNGRHWGKANREGGALVVMRTLYAEDGKVFMEKPDSGLLRKIEGGADEAIKAAKERFEFDSSLLFMPFLLQEPGTKLEVAGEAQSEDGKEQDVLKVTFDPNDLERTATYYVVVDRETGLIARVEIQKRGKTEAERLGYGYTQWVDGPVKYPGQVQNLGMKSEIVTFKDLKESAPDEDLWTPPPMI